MASMSAKLYRPGVPSASATAWLVSNDHALTAYHCILDADDQPYADGACFVLEFDSSERVEAVIAEYSEKVDAALLRILDRQFDTAGKIHFSSLPEQLNGKAHHHDGALWSSWGYPSGRVEGLAISGTIDSTNVPYHNGSTAMQLTCSQGGAVGRPLSGMSGAAVVHDDKLVGMILSAPDPLNQLVIHAAPIARVADQLTTLANIIDGKRQPHAAPGIDASALHYSELQQHAGTRVTPVKAIRQRANLVNKTTRLYGRDKEVLIIIAAIEEGARLITLYGGNGCGKSRVAGAVGTSCLPRYDKVYMADLLACNGAASMRTEIANTLDVKDAQDDVLDETLALVIGQQKVLVILDSAQQLQAAQPLIVHLLQHCPQLTILAVREDRLTWDGQKEFAHEIAPLVLTVRAYPLACDGQNECAHERVTLTTARNLGELNAKQLMDGLGASFVLQLFAERATWVCPHFTLTISNVELIAELCILSGGMPLAIEIIAGLAAPLFEDRQQTRLRAQLDKQRRQLVEDLQGLAGLAAAARLEDIIAFSADKLDPVTQELFWRLSLFVGGCTLEAAESIASALDCTRDSVGSRLEGLLGLGLLACALGVCGRRYYRLQPAVLAYCRQQLDASGKRDETAHAQVAYYAQLASRAERRQTLLGSAELIEWFELLEFDYANLRNAMAWAVAHPHDQDTIDAGLGIAGNLFWFWNLRGSLMEGLRWSEALIGLTNQPTRNRGAALYCSGGLSFLHGDFLEARTRLSQSMTIWKSLDDRRRQGFTLVILGMIALHKNQVAKALRQERDAVKLFRKLDDRFGLALALNDLANVTIETDRNQAKLYYLESISIWKELGSNWGLGLTTCNLGHLACRREDYQLAERHLKEALLIQEQNRYQWGHAESLKVMGDVLLGASKPHDGGKRADATRHYRDSFVAHQRLGRKQLLADCLDRLARVAVDIGKPLDAAWLIGAAIGMRTRGDHGLPPFPQYEHNSRIELARANANDDTAFDHALHAGSAAPFAEVSHRALAFADMVINRAASFDLPTA